MADVGAEFRKLLIAYVPRLRAFALALTGRFDAADDLVQDTLVHALASEAHFTPGTDLKAWLFTILRNRHVSNWRASQHRQTVSLHEVSGQENARAAEQIDFRQLRELKVALVDLKPEHRAALVLVGALGCTYDEVAEIFKCPVGTVKSRLNRARAAIAKALPDVTFQSVAPSTHTDRGSVKRRRRSRREVAADELATPGRRVLPTS